MARAKATKQPARKPKRSAAEIAAAMVGGAKPRAVANAVASKPVPPSSAARARPARSRKAAAIALDGETERLVAMVVDAAWDEGARRVLADHLIERGEPEWGEMVVTCLELARHDTADTLASDEAKALSQRGRELFTRHEAKWKALLKGLVHYVSWSRGGLHVSVKHDRLRDGLSRAMALLPIHTVKVLRFGIRTFEPAMLRQVAEAPVMQVVEHLELEQFFDRPVHADLSIMFGPPERLLHLRSLSVIGSDVDERSLALLGTLPWRQLATLRISVDGGTLPALLGGTGIGTLRTLAIDGWLEEADVIAIAKATQLRRLDELVIEELGKQGIDALARANHFQLRKLVLQGDVEDLAALLATPPMRALESLDIDDRFGADDAAALAAAKLPALHELRLWEAGDAAVAALAASTTLTGLRSLEARARVGDAGAIAIANGALRLAGLELGNKITDVGARAIADSEILSGLAKLDLKQNPLSNESKRVLRAKFGAGVATFSR